MTVRLDGTSKQEIARALNAAEKLLEAATHTPFNPVEISEMIRDCKSELDKAGPNVSRLRSLMVGIATSIQTVASLRPAYDAIKGGLALVGVTLPGLVFPAVSGMRSARGRSSFPEPAALA